MSRRSAAVVVHILMLLLALLFLFPFFWMLATSLKTDEELAESKSWWPSVPTFRATSPSTLEFRALQLRTLDARVFNLFDAKGIAKDWRVVAGNAKLVESADGAVLQYHFDPAKP